MEVSLIRSKDCVYSHIIENKLNSHFHSTGYNSIQTKFQAFDLTDLKHNVLAKNFYNSHIQILIISHHFLKNLRKTRDNEPDFSIGKILRKEKIISILLVDLEDIQIEDLNSAEEWFTMRLNFGVKLNSEFYSNLQAQVCKIYNSVINPSIQCSSESFTLFPRVISKNQSRMSVIFANPIDMNAKIHAKITNSTEEEIEFDFGLVNPYVGWISLPESSISEGTLGELTLFVNGIKLGKELFICEKPIQSTRNDRLFEKLFQSIPGFTKLFDEHISQKLSMVFNECPNTNPQDQSLEILNTTIISQSQDFPTMMHFATFYGLELTVWILLEESDGLEQCVVRNESGKSPIDLAQERGHTNIRHIIEKYREIMESMKECSYTMSLYKKFSEEIANLRKRKNSNDNQMEIEVSQELEKSRNSEVLEDPEILQNGVENESDGVLNLTNSESEIEVSEIETKLPEVPSSEENHEDSNKTPSIEIHDENNDLWFIPKATPRDTKSKFWHEYANIEEISAELDLDKIYMKRIVEQSSSIDQDYDIPPPRTRAYLPLEITSDEPPQLLARKIPYISKPSLLSPTDVYKKLEYIDMVPGPQEIVIVKSRKEGEISDGSDDTDGEDYQEIKKSKPDGRELKKQWRKQTLPSLLRYPENDGGSCIISDGADSENPSTPFLDIEALKSLGSDLIPSSKSDGNPKLSPKNLSDLIDEPDEQLLDVMDKFKNNIYTLDQVELIFNAWKQREDVKQTIQEKEIRLKTIQKDFRIIQEKLNKNSRTPHILKKMMTFGKKKQPTPDRFSSSSSQSLSPNDQAHPSSIPSIRAPNLDKKEKPLRKKSSKKKNKKKGSDGEITLGESGSVSNPDILEMNPKYSNTKAKAKKSFEEFKGKSKERVQEAVVDSNILNITGRKSASLDEIYNKIAFGRDPSDRDPDGKEANNPKRNLSGLNVNQTPPPPSPPSRPFKIPLKPIPPPPLPKKDEGSQFQVSNPPPPLPPKKTQIKKEKEPILKFVLYKGKDKQLGGQGSPKQVGRKPSDATTTKLNKIQYVNEVVQTPSMP